MDKIPPPPKFYESGDASKKIGRQRLIEAAERAAHHADTGAAVPAEIDRLVHQPQQPLHQQHPAHPPPSHPLTSRQQPSPYNPPEWSGLPPPSFQYSLEILKQGTIITHLPNLSSKPFWTFGRTPDNDIILDHPSSSRLHAILQFRSPPDPAAYLYDPGSTHGVYVNKAKHPIPPHQYHLLRVGDVFTLGQSSRMYVFGGAPDLMPPEEEKGLSKLGRKLQQHQGEAAMLEAMAQRRETDAAVAKSQMQAALASKSRGGGGTSWGIVDDDGNDNDGEGTIIDALGEVDWRAYALSNSLSDKQQKLADKIRKRESRIQHLSKEIENIRAKQGMEELSSGQATTVMRNEGSIEVARQEIEELEDLLCDSIRSATGSGGGGGMKKGKKRKHVDDGDDTVWDRTTIHNKKNKKKNGGGRGVIYDKEEEEEEEEEEEKDDEYDGALDVAALIARKETLVEEKERIEMDLVKEEAKEEEEGGGGGNADDSDALDAFMTGLKTTMEEETLNSLKKQLDGTNKEIGEVERLIKIADPDGWYSIEEEEGGGDGGSRKKRVEDVLRAKKKLQEQQDKVKRKRVEEEEKRKQAIERVEREQNEEEEEEEEEEGRRREQVMAMMITNNRKQPVGNIHRMEGDEIIGVVGGLQTMKKIDEAGEAVKKKMEGRRAEIAAKLSAMKGEKGGDSDKGGDITASLLEDLALLRGATAGYGAMAMAQGEVDDEGRE